MKFDACAGADRRCWREIFEISTILLIFTAIFLNCVLRMCVKYAAKIIIPFILALYYHMINNHLILSDFAKLTALVKRH